MAVSNPMVPKLYANQFTTYLGSHDVALLFGIGGVSSGVLNLSYPLAKQMAATLLEAIKNYEESTQQRVVKSSELDERLTAKLSQKK
jgi:hypothetical protein